MTQVSAVTSSADSGGDHLEVAQESRVTVPPQDRKCALIPLLRRCQDSGKVLTDHSLRLAPEAAARSGITVSAPDCPVQAALPNGSDTFRERRGWPPAGAGPLPAMAMSACAASAGARCPPGGVWRDSALSRRESQRSARAVHAAAGERAGVLCARRQPRTSSALSRPGRPVFPAAGRRRRSKTQGGPPATLTDWPMTARGSSCGRLW